MKEYGFPTKRDLALIGILAVSSCNTLESPKIPPETNPTPVRVERPNPTLQPAVYAVRNSSKDRGVGN